MITDGILGIATAFLVYILQLLPYTNGISSNIGNSILYILNLAGPWQYYLPLATVTLIVVILVPFEFILWSWIGTRKIYGWLRGIEA